MASDLTIQGNEINGYMVVRKIEDEWHQVTQRYNTYDEAANALRTFK